MSHAISPEDLARLTAAHETAQRARYEASAGQGIVRVVLNGLQEVVSIHIDPKAMRTGDPRPLEELLRSALNDAAKLVTRALYEQLGETAPLLGMDLEALQGDPTD